MLHFVTEFEHGPCFEIALFYLISRLETLLSLLRFFMHMEPSLLIREIKSTLGTLKGPNPSRKINYHTKRKI